MITEASIRSALASAPKCGKKSIELKDEGERGSGRLVLRIRIFPNRITPEWFVYFFRNEHRAKIKLGFYPTMPLATARKIFREEYAPTISAGAAPESRHARRRHKGPSGEATVTELFQAYVDHLESSGKRSWKHVKRILLSPKSGLARAIGPNKRASQVTTDDIVAPLAEIYSRGRIAMADNTRAFVSAAFSFGVKSAHSYKLKESAANWGIKVNPVSSIPTDSDAHRTLDRFLSPVDFKKLWDWSRAYDGDSQLMPALQLLMDSGQRVEEILRISDQVFDPETRMLKWDKTKNGLPHSIPLTTRAASILSALTPNRHGLYFPHRDNPERPAPAPGINKMIIKFISETGVEHFTSRTIRRTWKTLAGDAGISKDARDRLQNHSKSDVSSRHYDRYDYLQEKRAAVMVWADYMDRIIAGKIKNIGERDNVVPITQGAAA